METIIEIKNVTKTFSGKDQNVEALKGINLEIHKGEIYGIIGMSGAGKSTLVRCLNFLERPTTGTVVVEGKDLAALKDKELRQMRTQIAMIFQHFNLFDEATSALDPTTTKAILALLKEINQKYGITIVIITHEMAVVQEIGTHVAIIDHGELAESGTVEEVFTHPKSKAARKLVLMDDVNHYDEMKGQHCIRIVFKSNSSFEPVIANMVLAHRMPVNILLADTKDINGVAHGQMILQLPEDTAVAQKMIQYLKDRNLEVEELDHYVG